MKRIKTLTILLACCLLSFGTRAQDATYETYTLKNGLRVYLIHYGKLPALNVKLVLNTGEKNENPGQQGYSEIVANALLLGNKKYDQEAQNNMQFRLGANLSASSSKDNTTLTMNLLSRSLDEGFDLLSSVVLSPTFPKDKIELIKSQYTDFNSPSKMDIADLADVYSDYFIYGISNPFGRYYYKNQLQKITPEVLREYYEFNYTPKNCNLVICGNFEDGPLKATIEKYFGSWKSTYGDVNGVSMDQPVIKKKETGFINRRGATQCALQWSKTAPSVKDKDYLAFTIANKIFNVVLFKEIREKGGKTYGIRSNYAHSQFSNLFQVSCSVRSNEMYNTMELFDKTLKNFSAGTVEEKELKKVIYEETVNIKRLEMPDAVSGFFNPLVYNFEKRKNYIADLNALTLEDINKAIRKYFTPDSYKLVVAGDESAVKEQLQKIQGLVKFNAADIERDN
ncbi:MAG: insulinase family protein [Bacteroidetes bacterium]|nr:insulinase family protein [Bacteroidota bacterium]